MYIDVYWTLVLIPRLLNSVQMQFNCSIAKYRSTDRVADLGFQMLLVTYEQKIHSCISTRGLEV